MSDKEEKLDGRVLRSQRSRQAIINSALHLTLELGLIPTAQQISDEAGVTIRTLFRHFPEMDLLYREMHFSTYKMFALEYSKGSRSGSLDERITSMIKAFSSAYKKQQNLIVATKGMMMSSKFLTENYKKVQKALSITVLEYLPEMKQLSAANKETLMALVSFEFWNRMVSVQGVSQKRYTEQTLALVQVIFNGKL